MTETILLQLLADIRLILRAQTKPITHVGISEALANTASAPHSRLLLRVVDVMVATGELVRDINVDGGRCTYTRASTGDNRDTGKRVLKAFEFDLEEAAAPATAAAPAPANPATPEVVGSTVRARILNALSAGPLTRKQLIERLPADDPKHIDSNLSMLRNRGLVSRTALGQPMHLLPAGTVQAATLSTLAATIAADANTKAERRAEAESSAPAAAPATRRKPGAAGAAATVKESLTAAPRDQSPVFAGPITTLDGIVTDSPARDLAQPLATGMQRVIEALQDFGATLRDHANATPPAKPEITDLDTKVAVLRKLAPMVAADISAVLDAVANDLQTMAVAA